MKAVHVMETTVQAGNFISQLAPAHTPINVMKLCNSLFTRGKSRSPFINSGELDFHRVITDQSVGMTYECGVLISRMHHLSCRPSFTVDISRLSCFLIVFHDYP